MFYFLFDGTEQMKCLFNVLKSTSILIYKFFTLTMAIIALLLNQVLTVAQEVILEEIVVFPLS